MIEPNHASPTTSDAEPLTDEELNNWDNRYTNTADVELNFRAAAEIRTLRAALKKYGKHINSTQGFCVTGYGKPCNCGLDDALKGADDE